MTSPRGYAFFLGDDYVTSVTTSADSRGQQSLLVSAPGYQTHAHGYMPAAASGTTIGCSLRDLGAKRGAAGTHDRVELTTFARVRVAPGRSGRPPTIEVAAVGPSSTLTAQPVSAALDSTSAKRQRIDLPDSGHEVTLSFAFAPPGYRSQDAREHVLEWGPAVPGLVVCRVRGTP
jgi:hypothetical protein